MNVKKATGQLNCHAQPKLQVKLSLKAELALVLSSPAARPAGQPPGRPSGIVVEKLEISITDITSVIYIVREKYNPFF